VYTLGETGTLASGKNYTQTITGTDAYSTTQAQNSLLGTFSIDSTGTDAYSRGETGTASDGSPIDSSDSDSSAFSSTQTGNTFAGTVNLTLTGGSRYGLLEQFNNTADSANGGAAWETSRQWDCR